mgnify:CR=1 FL=1
MQRLLSPCLLAALTGEIGLAAAGQLIKSPVGLLKYVPATAQVKYLRCSDIFRLDGSGAQEICLGITQTEEVVLCIPPDPAQQFRLSTAGEANFNTVCSEGLMRQDQVLVRDCNAQSRFSEWSRITDGGLFGHTTSNVLRCKQAFNFEGFTRPNFQLQIIEADACMTVMDGPVNRSDDKLLVFNGLPLGQYRWRIDYEFFLGNKSQLECFFELNAVPGLHA